MCTVTPISMTVGANRIVPTIAIPHPLGNPELDKEKRSSCLANGQEKILATSSYGNLYKMEKSR